MQPRSALWRILAIVGGAVVFLVVNFVLVLDRCRLNEFMVECSGEPRHTVFVLVVAGALLVAAVLTKIGRAFAIGFGGALILLAVVSMGSCTPSWSDPYTSYRRSTYPSRAARADRDRTEQTVRGWTSAIDARPMEVSEGIALAGEVVLCAKTYAARNGGQFALSEAALGPCTALEYFGVSGDPGHSARHRVPGQRPDENVFGLPTTPWDGDFGWRAQYEIDPASGYTVTVTPDERLDHDWPRIYANGAGLVEVQTDQNAPRLEVSPAADLQRMVECLADLPAKEEQYRAANGRALGRRLTTRLQRLCPDLAPRVKDVRENNDEDKTHLSVYLPIGANGTPVYVAGWVVELRGGQASQSPWPFDLEAHGAVGGLPRYMARFGAPVEREVTRSGLGPAR